MGSFSVRFGVDTNYMDPEYSFLYVKVVGQASVACEDRDGSEQDQGYVKELIGFALNNAANSLSSQKVGYKDLTAHSQDFRQEVTSVLAEKRITLSSFNIMSINPDEKSREHIKRKDELKAMSSMTPEELVKKQEEAARKAQEYLDSLSPEERARVEEESKRRAEEAALQMKEAMEQARKIAASSGVSDPTAQAMATAAGINAMKAAAMTPASQPAPAKFCTNCGSPVNGGKFCGNCGKPL